MDSISAGAAAGAAATVPMTWAMELMHRLLPAEDEYPLPPREITEHLVRQAGASEWFSESDKLWMAVGAHLGYGAATGAIYGLLADRLPGRPILRGTAFGLGVWATSYLGLLPALRVLTPATQHPPKRSALMIAAHVVWGSALGIFTELIENSNSGEGLASLEGSAAPDAAVSSQ